MNSDYVLIQFSNAEASGQSIVQEAQTLSDTLQRLQNASSHLLSSGLQGAFVDSYQARAAHIDSSLYHLSGWIEATGHELVDVAQKFRQLNAESAAIFGAVGDNPYSFATVAPGAIDPRLAFYTCTMSSGVQPPPGSDYNLGSIVLDTNTILDHTSKIDQKFAKYAAPKIGTWLTNLTDNADTQDAIKNIAGIAQNEKVVLYGFAIVGGVIGWASGTDHSAGSLGANVVSSVVFAALGTNPAIGTLLAINSGVQLIGHAASGAIKSQADWLSNGDPAKAQEIRDTADKFGNALAGSDPTKLLTNVLTNVFEGHGDQVGKTLSDYGNNLGTTLSSGGTLIEDTANGIGQQLAKNPVVNEIAHDTEQAVSSVAHFFGF